LRSRPESSFAQSKDDALQSLEAKLHALANEKAAIAKENAALKERLKKIEAGRQAPVLTVRTASPGTPAPNNTAAGASPGLSDTTRGARAAYIPVKTASAPAPFSSNWTGFYGGINAGYGVASDPFSQNFAGITQVVDSRASPQGELFGGQLGYNFQSGHIVYGVEGDLQWANQQDTGCGLVCASTGGVNGAIQAAQALTWFGTARGRLGWATNNGALLYVTGGGAWGGVDATSILSAGAAGTAAALTETTHFTKSGWAVGAGAEMQIAGPWSAKI
jgi:outer membrane immunogenic protein